MTLIRRTVAAESQASGTGSVPLALTNTVIPFASAPVETDTSVIEWNFGGGGNSRIYVKVTTVYRVSIEGEMLLAGANENAILECARNGLAGVLRAESMQITGGPTRILPVRMSFLVSLVAGDYVEWRARGSVGGSFNNGLFTVERT